jgi:hypothetical protein
VQPLVGLPKLQHLLVQVCRRLQPYLHPPSFALLRRERSTGAYSHTNVPA